jgi:hypothetical protein
VHRNEPADLARGFFFGNALAELTVVVLELQALSTVIVGFEVR